MFTFHARVKVRGPGRLTHVHSSSVNHQGSTPSESVGLPPASCAETECEGLCRVTGTKVRGQFKVRGDEGQRARGSEDTLSDNMMRDRGQEGQKTL